MSNKIQCCSCFKFFGEEHIAINEFLGDENHVEIVCFDCAGGEVWDEFELTPEQKEIHTALELAENELPF